MLFDPQLHTSEVWIRALAPPGAVALDLSAWGEMADVHVSGRRRNGYVLVDTSGDASRLHVELGEPVPAGSEIVLRFTGVPRGRSGAGALAGPISWRTRLSAGRAAPWPQLGLSDYSGMVRYGRDLKGEVIGPEGGVLRLAGLQGTARIMINDVVMGTVLTSPFEIDLPPAARGERIRLVVEVSNTLANHYNHYPSPYAAMQLPGGGFQRASIHRRAASSASPKKPVVSSAL